jgi:hypothetical protein
MGAEERRLGEWLSSWPHKDALEVEHMLCAVRVYCNTAVRVEDNGPPYVDVPYLLVRDGNDRTCDEGHTN